MAETGPAWLRPRCAEGSGLANAASDQALWGTGLANAASDQSPLAVPLQGSHCEPEPRRSSSTFAPPFTSRDSTHEATRSQDQAEAHVVAAEQENLHHPDDELHDLREAKRAQHGVAATEEKSFSRKTPKNALEKAAAALHEDPRELTMHKPASKRGRRGGWSSS
jgi:hypothetical protein